MPANELTIREKWGELFLRKTGEKLPESIENVDRIVAKFYGLEELPIVSHSIIPLVDMREINEEIDEFLRRGR